MNDPAVASSSARPRLLVMLHWATLLALCAGVSFIWVRDAVDVRALRAWLLVGHVHMGLLVLGLCGARMALRFRLGKLPAAGKPSRALRIAAVLTHAGLYALLLLGWASMNAQGKTVHLLGVPLPALVGADEDLGDQILAWHVNAAWALLGLTALHASAALWHQFVLRDSLLVSMLPQRRS